MTSIVDVIVAVPAHDEQDRIGFCLRSVLAAIHVAREAGVVARAAVGVAAHGCSDATVAEAALALAADPKSTALVQEDCASATVGEVRERLVSDLLMLVRRPASQVWLFNTDADSTVPHDWMLSTLRQAHTARAAAVVGLVDLVGWEPSPRARRDYARLIRARMHADGHEHVYGANLAVRLDAYLAVGGFPGTVHGEDHALVRRLREGGWPVLTSFAPMVRTSARMPGRADHGLGTLLQELEAEPTPSLRGTGRGPLKDTTGGPFRPR